MWGRPLWMLVWPAILVAFIVTVVHWLGEKGGGGERPPRSARDILDQLRPRGD